MTPIIANLHEVVEVLATALELTGDGSRQPLVLFHHSVTERAVAGLAIAPDQLLGRLLGDDSDRRRRPDKACGARHPEPSAPAPCGSNSAGRETLT